jgi:Fe-S cluster assembly ATP-binding protein
MIKIENLSVKVHEQNVLKGVNLEIREGEIHALLGPNASGKSTLAYAIMGFPEYEVVSGKILFEGKDVTNLSIEERAKLGVALAFQNPPSIKGVTLSALLKTISKQKFDVKDFPIFFSEILEREINVGFSGGERKFSELLQVISLKPSFVILDEFDAGLDIINLEKLTSIIQDKLICNNVSILVITHRGNILQFLEPDVAHVMLKGKIVCTMDDWRKMWKTIRRYGYEKCKEGKLSSSKQ